MEKKKAPNSDAPEQMHNNPSEEGNPTPSPYPCSGQAADEMKLFEQEMQAYNNKGKLKNSLNVTKADIFSEFERVYAAKYTYYYAEEAKEKFGDILDSEDLNHIHGMAMAAFLGGMLFQQKYRTENFEQIFTNSDQYPLLCAMTRYLMGNPTPEDLLMLTIKEEQIKREKK